MRPLPALGRISYGVYLWHWPVFVVLTAERTGLTGPALLALRLGVTLVLATLSWRLVERPVLNGALVGWRGRLSLPITAAAVLVGLIVATPTAAAPSIAVPGTVVTVPARGSVQVAHAQPTRDGPRQPHLGPLRVLLLGDSVALTLGQALPDYPGLSVTSEAILGCGLARGTPYRYFGSVRDGPPECETWPQRWSEAVARTDPDVVAVLVGRWEVMDRMRDGRWQHIGEPAFDDYIAGELEQAITVLGAHGARVVFLTAPYYHRGERPDGGTWPEDEPWRADAYNAVLSKVVARHSGSVALLPFGAEVSPGRAYTRVRRRPDDALRRRAPHAAWGAANPGAVAAAAPARRGALAARKRLSSGEVGSVNGAIAPVSFPTRPRAAGRGRRGRGGEPGATTLMGSAACPRR